MTDCPTPLFVYPLAIAMARTVVETDTENEPLYRVEPAVGVEPSSV